MELRIGTSGWHYKHWLGTYYEADARGPQMFARYIRDFDTVEINNTFYHLPLPATFATWKKTAPAKFLYAVKGSRFLTHMKKLKEPEEGIARFFAGVKELGRKAGPVLFQLPPRWKKNAERLDAFLAALPRGYRYAFEFRETSWIDDEILAILRARKAAFCIYEIAGYQSPLVATTNFVYVRLHGPDIRAYQGSYSRRQLQEWAERIRQWQSDGLSVYFYFDNDQAAYAVDNALELKRLCRI
jgi:uncharacterized protein YecE (DUF72 family)